MHPLSVAILVIIHACSSRAGIFEVIDYDRRCLIWSNGNYGCTGYSAPFAILDGDDCSKLSEQYSALSVDVCGTEDGSPAAWIQVNRTGEVIFFNKNGNSSTCILNKGLKAGSWCAAYESEVFSTKFFSSSALSTASVSITNTSLSATTTPSTATTSTATTSTATPSTATPSIATPSIATTQNELNTVLCHVIVYPSSTMTTSCSSL